MGVIIKYLVEFPDVSLKVSNDITLGDFLLDATIKVAMKRGTDGCTFEISLFDLPQIKADPLSVIPIPTPPETDPSASGGGSTSDSDKKSVLSDVGKKVVITLGYFDGSFEKTIDGIVDSAIASVKGENLVTTITGRETSTRALKLTQRSLTLAAGTKVYDAIGQLCDPAKTKANGGEFPTLSMFPPASATGADAPAFGNKSISGSVMDNVGKLVAAAGAEMLVVDRTLYVGAPIKVDNYSPDKFTPGVNLAKFEPFKKNIPPQADTVSVVLKEASADGFHFTTTGDPKMRPGQKISVELDTISKTLEYRIQELTHSFSTMSGGYTCDGSVTQAVSDDNAKRRQDYAKKPTADTIIDGLGEIVSARQKQIAIEIGQIKTYTEGSANSSAGDASAHRPNTSDVYVGQVYDKTETQPSIHTEVQNLDNQVAKGKPMVSPFAWHKCGLVVPVYPGMKAVLSHDLTLKDDALISGFIWSEKPAFAPPPNKKGDWWLSLPVLAGGGDPPIPPPDHTQIANDLTANSGLRVIEVSGLKITIGKMQSLGTRPTEGNADEFLIEHKKATIHIDANGAIEIIADATAGKGKFTIAQSGEISMTASGGVTLKVGASAVEIS